MKPAASHRSGSDGRPYTDQATWADFVRRYGKLIHGWCRHWRRVRQMPQDEVARLEGE